MSLLGLIDIKSAYQIELYCYKPKKEHIQLRKIILRISTKYKCTKGKSNEVDI